MLLVAASTAAAQADAPAKASSNPFAPPVPNALEGATPGARERFAESLALLGARLEKDPADLVALERAAALLEQLDRTKELVPAARAALGAPGMTEERAGPYHALLGHLLVVEAATLGWGNIIIIGGGNLPAAFRQRIRGFGEAAIRLYTEAEGHLRKAVAANPKDARSLMDLATALEGIDEEKNATEAQKLRNEATALVVARGGEWEASPLYAEVEQLRAKAMALEGTESPDHEAALVLRKRALVLDACRDTIPFDYEPAFYEPASLLAPAEVVTANLTRTYRTTAGGTDTVEPLYYPPPENRRIEIVKALAADKRAGAAALLLSLVLRGGDGDAVAEAARAALVKADHPAVRPNLPRLLDRAVFDETGTYPVHAQRALIRLAAELRVKEAAPVLARKLAHEEDLVDPRGLPAALASIGRAEDAGVLIAAANDEGRDVYLRRCAVDAAARLAPDRLAEIVPDPRIDVSLAAARYRIAPNDADRTRLLGSLERMHEADDAARYCVELGIAEAGPILTRFLQANPDHYAAETLKSLLDQLPRR